MNILFIYTLQSPRSYNAPLGSFEHIQFGISYISAILKRHGYHTKLAIFSRVFGKKNWVRLDRQIEMFRPHVICFTAINTEFFFVASIARYVKKNYPHIFLLIGGSHATLNPEEVCLGDFDAVCVGEGEYPTLELILQLRASDQPSKIPNLWIKHNGVVEKNAPRPFLENLDSLPIPDRFMWARWIEQRSELTLSILLGRGCPFECSYCCNHALKGITTGLYCRLRSPEKIVEEITYLRLTHPRCTNIYFEVETFGANKEWSEKLCNRLMILNQTLNKPLSFSVNLRVTPRADYSGLLELCKKSNFEYINVGLESGSERLRREVLNRNYSNDDIITTVKVAKKIGLKVRLYNIIGIPGETLDDFKETVRVNRECQPDGHHTSIFFPYKGTKIYSLCIEKGLLDKKLDMRAERLRPVLNLPGFSKKQIQRSYTWFNYYVYKGHRPFYWIILSVIVKNISLNPYITYLRREIMRLPILKEIRDIISRQLIRIC